QRLGYAGRLADEDRVPALEHLGVREPDPVRRPQAREILAVADRAGLVTHAGFVDLEARTQLRGVALGMRGPELKDAPEVEIDHDIAEIEQQGVDALRLHRCRQPLLLSEW